jgi:hypothetical protein
VEIVNVMTATISEIRGEEGSRRRKKGSVSHTNKI